MNYTQNHKIAQITPSTFCVSRFSRYRCHTNILSTLFLYTFLRLPRDWHRLVARHFKLGSKDQEPNLKCQDVYQKLLASFPIADDCGACRLIEPCLTPIDGRVG